MAVENKFNLIISEEKMVESIIEYAKILAFFSLEIFFSFFSNQSSLVIAKLFNSFILNCRFLTSNTIRSEKLSDEDVKSIFNALKKNSSINSLSLFCRLFDEGAKFLSNALKINSTIIFLDISNNYIREEGVKNLSEALKINSTLSFVDISNNYFGQEGVLCLTDAMKINSTLTFIAISKNHITDVQNFYRKL
jgi:Ran GTPase-activating protein (RanGAP) involved in mRNA processing and transport